MKKTVHNIIKSLSNVLDRALIKYHFSGVGKQLTGNEKVIRQDARPIDSTTKMVEVHTYPVGKSGQQ